MFRKTPTPPYLPPAPRDWPENFRAAWAELVEQHAGNLAPNKLLPLELAARELTMLRMAGDPMKQVERGRLLLELARELRAP